MTNLGTLVGWTSRDHESGVGITLECFDTLGKHRGDPKTYHMLMTRQQAAVLGNHLMQISGQSPPSRKDRSWITRFFG